MDRASELRVVKYIRGDCSHVPFPSGVLPESVRLFIQGSAEHSVFDESSIATPLLSVLASVIGNTYRIRLGDSWCEPSVLWTAVVGGIETLDGSSVDLVRCPHGYLQTEADKALRRAIKAHRKATTGRSRAVNGCILEANFHGPQYYADCEAMGQVARTLNENPFGILLYRSSIHRWRRYLHLRQLEGRCNAADIWRAMYMAGKVSVEHGTPRQPAVSIERAAVSMISEFDTRSMVSLVGAKNRKDWMIARFLPTMPPWPTKDYSKTSIDPTLTIEMRGTLIRLASLRGEPVTVRERKTVAPVVDPIDLQLTPGAGIVFGKWYHALPARQEGLTGYPADVSRAMARNAARLSLVLHLTRWASEKTECAPGPVSEWAVTSGTALADWFLNEASRMLREFTAFAKRRRDAVHRAGVEVNA